MGKSFYAIVFSILFWITFPLVFYTIIFMKSALKNYEVLGDSSHIHLLKRPVS